MRGGAARSFAHEIVLGLLLAGVLGFAAWIEPAFLGREAQLDLATHVTELLLLALPMTLIIITGGIDLSVGSVMALSGVTLGLLYQAGVSVWLAAGAAATVGAAAGAVNGAFVAALRVHPLIVTLATLAAFRGLAEGISLGRPVSGFPAGFLRFGEGTVAGVPIPVLVVGVMAVAAAAAVRMTVGGFRIYAIGDSERAARHSAVPVDRMKLGLYALSGLAAGLAAVLFVARRNTAKADIGAGIELEVITAVVLGGTSIFGGRGTIVGTVLGVLVVHEVRELVSWHWRRDELFPIVVGTILIASVLLNNLASRRRG